MGGPRPRTFAEHGLVTRTTNTVPPGGPRRGHHEHRGGARRLCARARTRPLVRIKQRKRSVLRRPQESKALRPLPPIDPPRLHARAAKPRTRSTVREHTGRRDEPLDHQVLRTFIEASPRLGRTRSPPTSLAGYRAGGLRARGGHRSMTTRACCSSEEPTNPPVAPCAHAWNPPARCIMPLHPFRVVKITF